MEAPAPPAPGTKLISEGKEAGEVTSSCVSPSLGKVVALAYVRREFAEAGTKLVLASGVPAEVVALPFYTKIETGK
jgi:aminomethyltransferase